MSIYETMTREELQREATGQGKAAVDATEHAQELHALLVEVLAQYDATAMKAGDVHGLMEKIRAAIK